MGQIFPGPDAVLEEAGHIGQRFPILMGPVDDIFAAAQLVGPVFELLVHAFQHFIEGFIGQEAPCIGTILGLVVIQEFPAIEDHFHHLGGIYISCIMPAVFFPRNIDFHTAHYTVFPGIFQAESFPEAGFDSRAVVVQFGMAAADPDDFCRLHIQFIGCLFMEPDAQPRIHHPSMGCCFQEEHGQIVGGIIAIPVYPADGQAFASEPTAVPYGHGPEVFQLRRIIDLHILVFDQFQGKFFGDLSSIQICFVVRIQPLVHPAIGDGMAIAFGLDQYRSDIEQLQSLPERFRRTAGHLVQVGSHGLQFRFPFGILGLCCHLSCQICIPFGPDLSGVHADDHGIVGIPFIGEIGIMHIQQFLLGRDVFDDPIEPSPQDISVISSQMAYPCIMVQVGLENLLACF